MSISSWFPWKYARQNKGRAHRAHTAKPRQPGPRLTCEQLEHRIVPTTLGPLVDLSDPDVLAACGSNGAEKES